jgi:peptidyl-prolyl cis-trans isomerase D
VFGNEAVKNKRNTDAVEVGPNQMASARVVKHEPARTLPLAEVQRPRAQRRGATQARRWPARTVQRAWRNCKADARLAATGPPWSRSQPQGPAAAVLDAVLKADVAKGRRWSASTCLAGLRGGPGADKVMPRDIQPGGEPAAEGPVAQAWARAESEAYYRALKHPLQGHQVKPDVVALQVHAQRIGA